MAASRIPDSKSVALSVHKSELWVIWSRNLAWIDWRRALDTCFHCGDAASKLTVSPCLGQEAGDRRSGEPRGGGIGGGGGAGERESRCSNKQHTQTTPAVFSDSDTGESAPLSSLDILTSVG